MNPAMKEKLARIAALPSGVPSPSGHYWCVTCKKFFRMESPTCPYMTNMCVNNAIPIESLPPANTVAYERFGLFYPKFPQRALARLAAGVAEADRPTLGHALAQAYLDELAEWQVLYRDNPLEALKSFTIFATGCEVAQRNLGDRQLLVVMDPQYVWEDQEALRQVLDAALATLGPEMGFALPINLEFMPMVPGPLGRYFCPKCRMYFEFGRARERVVCPLMPQKCMFDPTAIKGEYPLADLLKIYRITPQLYARLMAAARSLSATPPAAVREQVQAELADWGFGGTPEEYDALWALLGL